MTKATTEAREKIAKIIIDAIDDEMGGLGEPVGLVSAYVDVGLVDFGEIADTILEALSAPPMGEARERARGVAPTTEQNFALREACQRMADDYQTSAAHHPAHVLVPADAFNEMRALLRHQPPAGSDGAGERITKLRAAIEHARFQINDGQKDCVFYNLGVALKDDEALASTPAIREGDSDGTT